MQSLETTATSLTETSVQIEPENRRDDSEFTEMLRSTIKKLTDLKNRYEDLVEVSVYASSCNTTHFMLTISAIVGTLTLQTFMLSEGKYFQTKSEDEGTILSIGLLIQLATYMSLSKPYIEMSRKYGVRNLSRYGATIYMIGCLCSISRVPILSNFFACQFLFGNAFTALLCVPWKSSEGSAFNIFMMSQVVINVMVIFASFFEVSYTSSLIYASALLFLGFIILSFFMDNQNQRINNERTNQEVKDLIKTNKWLWMLIVLRVALTIFFGGIATFATLHYHAFMVDNDNKNSLSSSRTISQLAFSIPPLFSIIYGIFLKKDHENLTINLSVFACLSSALFWIVIPIVGYESELTWILANIISGIGGSGIFSIGEYIQGKFLSTVEQRIVKEYLRRVQLVPVMILVLLCGLMYDYWMKDAAFILIGLILALCGLIMKKTPTRVLLRNLDDLREV